MLIQLIFLVTFVNRLLKIFNSEKPNSILSFLKFLIFLFSNKNSVFINKSTKLLISELFPNSN